MAFTSAPLLAGFAVTFIGLILGSTVSMHWANATLAAFTTAAMLLILSTQFAFTARIAALLGGVAMALVPGGELEYVDTERLIAIGIAVIATIIELT